MHITNEFSVDSGKSLSLLGNPTNVKAPGVWDGNLSNTSDTDGEYWTDISRTNTPLPAKTNVDLKGVSMVQANAPNGSWAGILDVRQ